ncbi:N-acetylmuramoyl-L-alanine amidase family protein [Neobacillus citreus]|uniref:N-acetylmuramoyl-L-alanine amidase n=1 Tax=Neobacillus citreus TaxID=2833578 RepID=A0A942T2Z3_9BACI|nr:N-acetylmuramoyl-L-alanine amidase [Neobacillus citreus]MCH6266540.1 N-acetylmuramoyl-L-alanine amidase [Neobacillus citreus]
MKKLIRVLIVGMFIAGSSGVVNMQNVYANSYDPANISQQTEATDFTNIISAENGKDEIVSTPPGEVSLRVLSNFVRDGEFILYNNGNISMYTKPNGSVDGGLGPQVLHSTKRNGQWFLINSYQGERWVYNDENIVNLRDVAAKNAELTLGETVYIYSEPFSVYRTEETIAPTTVHVIKQAGSWFLIDYNSRQVWITTENAKYKGTVDTFDTTSIYGIPYKKMIIPTGNISVRPGTTLKPDYITVHNTANTASGADAEMHGRYLLNQAATNPDSWVSWHFTVDDKQIVQHLPLSESAFHAGDGDGPGNRSSIGIEITENADGNYAKAEENAKKLIAYLIDQLNIPMENVKPHRDWSGKNCPRVILSNGWSNFITSLQQVYNTYHVPTVYRVVTGGFLGEENVKQKLGMLQAQTGWWASYEPLQQTAPYYRIVTGEYTGEEAAAEAMNAVQSETGLWMTYEKTRPAYSIYRIVTGGFKGEDNVQQALEGLKRDTGWWATFEPTGEPDVYRIVTGGIGGESNVIEALNRVKERGWWATYEENGEYVYYYRIRTGEFIEESSAKQALAYFTNKGWWATYEPSGRIERYYRIVTGGFAGREAAEEKAKMVQNSYGWWTSTETVR